MLHDQRADSEPRLPLAVLAVALASVLPAFLVLPASDDWGTIRPHSLETLGVWYRSGVFFRPFHGGLTLVGHLLPHEYLGFLHAVTAAGHVLSVGLLWWLLSKQLARTYRSAAAVAACLYAFFPGTSAAVLSLDGAAQTWSTALGLGALVVASSRGAGALSWPLLALLAAVWKESGLAWFLLVPAYQWLQTSNDARAGALRASHVLAQGAGGVLLYAALRLSFSETAQLGAAGGRYALRFDPAGSAYHLMQLLGASWTTIDTVALFGSPRSLTWTGLSLALSLPLLLLATVAVLRQSWRARLLGAAMLLLAAGPHLGLGHVSEMYAHPLAAVSVLLFCPALVLTLPTALRRWLPGAVCLFAAAAIAVSGHKAWRMIETGRGARELGERLALRFVDKPRPSVMCSVPHLPSTTLGYSVFDAPAARASGWGAAVLREWQWRHPQRLEVEDSVEACKARQPDVIVVFDGPRSFHLVP